MTAPVRRHAQQTLASDPTRSAWVTANAGTGKTHVLVDRILRLLLAGTRPAGVLCLTFTKAAAAEMAGRLSEVLGQWSVLAEADLDDHLRALTGAAPDAETRRRARHLLAETLETPGGLNLRTIHSFCESLLGRFPLESGVAPHFSVIDERTAAELMAEARNRLFRRALGHGGDALRQALDRVAVLADETRFDALMADLARQRGRLAQALERAGGIAGLRAVARATLGLAPDDTADGIAAEARTGTDTDTLCRARDVLLGGKKTDRQRAADIAAWLDGGAFDAYALAFQTKDHQRRQDLATTGLREAYPELEDVLRSEQDRVFDLARRLRALDVADAGDAITTLGAALVEDYAVLKGERAVLDYDDLIGFARHLMAGHGGASWVHYKLDGGIDHVLVDEAQDTSLDQWAVIQALTAEFFAGEGARAAARTVFVVGDEKQSIFSFQGADLETFRAVHASLRRRVEAIDPRLWRDVELALSFRSTGPVLDTVDAVFGRSPARDGVIDPEARLDHKLHRAGEAGRVELWPLVEPDERADEDPWDAPLDRPSPASAERRLADRIAERIGAWLKDGEPLPAAGRPIEPADVMILGQRRGPFYQHMVRALKQRGIPVAGADRMVLTEQIAVMDLIALARFLLLPDDDLSLAEVLKSPLMGWDDEDLFAVAHDRDGTLWQAVQRHPGDRAAEARRHLAAWLSRADHEPPYDFLARLLGPDGGRRAFLDRLGDDAGDTIDEFLNLALLHEREHVPSWQGFLAWVAAAATEVKRDLEQVRDAVRVMTVHGAKGLQANIVVLPDTVRVPPAAGTGLFWDHGDRGFDVPLWVPNKEMDVDATAALRAARKASRLREYRRLLYVAMTRARERLYVCGWQTRKNPAEGNWHDAVAPVLADLGAPAALPWGGQALRLDRPQEKEVGPEPAAPRPTPLPLPAWAREPAPAEPEPPRPLAPSRPADDEPPVRSPVGDDGGDRFRRGRLIHRLLQMLPELPAADRAAAAAAVLARPVHGLDTDAQAAIAAEVLGVIGHPDLVDLFGPDSLAEAPLAGAVNGTVVSARVDRLVVGAQTVTVIDYKTDRTPPDAAEDVPRAYLRQMAAYRALLARVFPGRTVRCLLLWTAGPTVTSLPDTLLEAHAP